MPEGFVHIEIDQTSGEWKKEKSSNPTGKKCRKSLRWYAICIVAKEQDIPAEACKYRPLS